MTLGKFSSYLSLRPPFLAPFKYLQIFFTVQGEIFPHPLAWLGATVPGCSLNIGAFPQGNNNLRSPLL